jgi:hypothetical protein
MPQFGIHLKTLDNTIEKLESIDEKYADFFDNQRKMIMARWGAIGPDVFFWSFYERNRGNEAIENTIFLGYRIMEPFDEIKKILDPIGDNKEKIKDFISGGVDDVIKQMNKIISSLKAVIIGGTVAECFDFVSWFELALAKGQNEPDWYWFDMLHYRNTGEFAKNLLMLANEESDQQTREMLIAYALGYMTHLSTDILGHPYVNRFCGGPYRTQWHRHHLGENCMDTWAWDHYTPDIGEPQVNGIRNEIAFAGVHEAFEQGNSRVLMKLFFEGLPVSI